MKTSDSIIQRFDTAYKKNQAYWIQDSSPKDAQLFSVMAAKHFPRGKLLDLGCGTGWLSLYFAQQGFIVSGVDTSETALRIARSAAKKSKISNVSFQKGSIFDLPYENDSFDILFDKGLFHHIPQMGWRKYLHETVRVLNTGGFLYLSVFSDKSTKRNFSPKQAGRMWNRSKDTNGYWNYDHFFTKKSLRAIFEKKFEILSLTEDAFIGKHGSHKLHITLRKK